MFQHSIIQRGRNNPKPGGVERMATSAAHRPGGFYTNRGSILIPKRGKGIMARYKKAPNRLERTGACSKL